ncbi:MAG: FAD-dependent oxidoreductase, partial [Victivallales bacterium]|nr:FAD-dependent oxidoreductase [Victivallales bacterium]
PFRTEGLKLLLDELADEAGVKVRFFTRLIDMDADAEGRNVRGAILHNVEGYRYIRAKTFIDATGDAVLASLCGAACREAGRDTERPMPATLASLHTGIDWAHIGNQQQALAKAIEEDHFSQPDRHLPGLSRAGDRVGYLNGGHVFNLDALRCRSLSDGMMLGRRLVQEYVTFYRQYVAGCEDLELVTTASLMGIRESRRVVGECELTIGDYLARRQFPDQIGLFNKFVDVHPYDNSIEQWQRFEQEHDRMRLGQGECFGIPYRILVPKGWHNLWVAGRCNSSDVLVHGSIRVMPAAAMMGQAAGTAAVQAIGADRAAFEVDPGQLVATLREQGAYLP